MIEEILELIDARKIIRSHLRHQVHRGVPVTCSSVQDGVDFTALVSADHRHEGAFRWPEDDSWVRYIRGHVSFHDVAGHLGDVTQIVFDKVHRCGIEMAKSDPLYVDGDDD